MGNKGGFTTRKGATLRHAASFLRRQPEQKKLIQLVSDGEPVDIDLCETQYPRYDTKKAVEVLATNVLRTFCLTLDHNADDYVSRILGQKD